MKELLDLFSVEQIILFIVIGAAALKGVIAWIDWLKERINKVADKKMKKEEVNMKIEALIKSQEAMQEQIGTCQVQIKDNIESIRACIDLLMESDKDDIKAWITEKHHYFCYQLGCIDDFNLNCIENRYKHYVAEGGNSFIEDLMNEIRALPKTNNIRTEIQKLNNIKD